MLAQTRPRTLPSTQMARLITVFVLTIACVLSAVGAITARADASTLNPNDPKPISDWNAIAVSTLLGDTTKSPVETFLYMGFVQAAVYDAVVGIHPRFAPYTFDEKPTRPASAQAAAVAAAHRILETYRPNAKATLDAAMATSLAELRGGKAVENGVAYGHAVADNLIAERANDGRYAPVTFDTPPAPGVWRPTPPLFAPMSVPWMGGVTPMLVDSGQQFGTPGPPPALTSPEYTQDFNEVKAYGAKENSARSQEQTDIALFFSGNAIVQYNAALRDLMSSRSMHLTDAARLFAAVDMTTADSVISIWYSKLHYGFWRPITAIHLADTDDNPDTAADPKWDVFLATGTPPYPDYVSGYSGVTGAFTRSLARTLGDIDVTLISSAVPGATRHYTSEEALNQDVIDARVWLGIHFRFADTAGVRMGQQVADYGLDRFLD